MFNSDFHSNRGCFSSSIIYFHTTSRSIGECLVDLNLRASRYQWSLWATGNHCSNWIRLNCAAHICETKQFDLYYRSNNPGGILFDWSHSFRWICFSNIHILHNCSPHLKLNHHLNHQLPLKSRTSSFHFGLGGDLNDCKLHPRIRLTNYRWSKQWHLFNCCNPVRLLYLHSVLKR